MRSFRAGHLRIEVTAHFDNSPFNPFNPDATVAVKPGPQTIHEMMFGFFFYTDDDERLELRIDPKTGGCLPPRGRTELSLVIQNSLKGGDSNWTTPIFSRGFAQRLVPCQRVWQGDRLVWC